MTHYSLEKLYLECVVKRKWLELQLSTPIIIDEKEYMDVVLARMIFNFNDEKVIQENIIKGTNTNNAIFIGKVVVPYNEHFHDVRINVKHIVNVCSYNR